MSFCYYCGHELKDSSKFCPNCGKQVNEKKENNTMQYENSATSDKRCCPQCNSQITDGAEICYICGYSFNLKNVNHNTIENFEKGIKSYNQRLLELGNVFRWKDFSILEQIGWILLNYFTLCIPFIVYLLKHKRRDIKKQIEQEKVAFVRNFRFPNDGNAIEEALTFINTELIFLEGQKSNQSNKFWSEQLASKAHELGSQLDRFSLGNSFTDNILFEIDKRATNINNSYKL